MGVEISRSVLIGLKLRSEFVVLVVLILFSECSFVLPFLMLKEYDNNCADYQIGACQTFSLGSI